MVLSDTVGFIRDLPHDAGRVLPRYARGDGPGRPAAACGGCVEPGPDAQIAEVDLVLREIGAGELPQVIVLNKADLTALPAGFERDEYGRISRLRVSAKTGAGMDFVRLAIDEFRSGSTLPDSSSRAVA